MRRRTLTAALTVMCGVTTVARADPILVEGGSNYQVVSALASDGTRWSSGSLFLPPEFVHSAFPPDHGYTVIGRELFNNAASACAPCAPSDLVNLSASFALRGPSFLGGGPVLSVWGLGILNFTTPTVQVPSPPSDPRFPLVVTAPFQFDAGIQLFGEPGTVPLFADDLVGAGLARALLVGSGRTWSFAQLDFVFADQTPVPEPGTMLLFATGAGMAVQRARRRLTPCRRG